MKTYKEELNAADNAEINIVRLYTAFCVEGYIARESKCFEIICGFIFKYSQKYGMEHSLEDMAYAANEWIEEQEDEIIDDEKNYNSFLEFMTNQLSE